MLNAVEISNLTVKYPDLTALDGVSFTIKQGELLVLLDLTVQVNLLFLIQCWV